MNEFSFDSYLINGCKRCKFGGTPQCKVLAWTKELSLLRKIASTTGLIEEIKWGVPVYTYNGKNIFTINALKDSANIGFYKGVLLSDKHKLLQQQGNLQSDRIIKFTSTTEINQVKDILKDYILEAIQIEESGKKVEFQKNPETIPEELLQEFAKDPKLQKAFESLTQGRQRGYIIYFSQPKQSETRTKRIQKYKDQIFAGIGIHDKYKGKK